MVVIKSYKIFERGEGVEEENDNLPLRSKFKVGDVVMSRTDRNTSERCKIVSVEPNKKYKVKTTLGNRIYPDRKEEELKLIKSVDETIAKNPKEKIANQAKQLELDFSKATKQKDNKVINDYVLGIPSGEVVLIDDLNDLKMIIDRKLAHWTHDFRGQVLNCYCTPDKNIEKIKEIVKFLRRERGGSDDKKIREICEDYRNEMALVLGKKYVVAYLPNKKEGIEYFLIIPDLNTNFAKFRSDIGDMAQVTHKMWEKYPPNSFGFGPSSPNSGIKVKYYGLPSED